MNGLDFSPLNWLMAWYRAQCNGDWEHQNGIRLSTIDNPGWSLDIDLAETALETRHLPGKFVERSKDDWVFVEATDGTFRARGGPGNLAEMIICFSAFVEGRPIIE